jgi:phosphoribosyl-AMP cyclohydrolase / phosphoribosyl-ATP pyrophosphohydrolase
LADSTLFDIDALDWDKQGGLLPAIVQDAGTLRILMLGYMSRESLALTLAGGRVAFFSRSRQALWTKGESSGNTLELVSVETDCDRDSLLVLARPHGPTCHTGAVSCFAQAPHDAVAALDAVVAQRQAADSDASYTRRLFDAGIARIAQKVGEEGVETALAAVTADDEALRGEAADLTYHLLVLLRARGLDWNDVRAELARRAGG